MVPPTSFRASNSSNCAYCTLKMRCEKHRHGIMQENLQALKVQDPSKTIDRMYIYINSCLDIYIYIYIFVSIYLYMSLLFTYVWVGQGHCRYHDIIGKRLEQLGESTTAQASKEQKKYLKDMEKARCKLDKKTKKKKKKDKKKRSRSSDEEDSENNVKRSRKYDDSEDEDEKHKKHKKSKKRKEEDGSE
eukprot:GHVL01041756.1.p1 GENE.GHVL01041756.1~~GHVL01041756.1.p1  ORF type:complete len:196 (-),score=31.58 GHVL01041756.1:128-694(-)